MNQTQIESMRLALGALEGLINRTSAQSIYSFMETERRIAISACVGLREALAEQPAPMIRGDIRDGLVDDEPAHQHIEHCLWARNGNQPCPHVQPAQQQEPVGRLESDPYEGHVFVPRIDGDWSMLGKNLYTSPQAQRTWAGLTDEDIKEAEWLLSAIKEHEAYTLQEQLLVEGVDVFARAIEAKLREKNNG